MQDLVKELTTLLKSGQMKLATAESCTGGLASAAMTDLAGSSEVFERGFVSYSNEAKTEMLGVPAELIAAHGAVSIEVARAMAEGAIKNSRADVAVSITGIAGPDGGSEEKPVGTVCFGLALKCGDVISEQCIFHGDRRQIRRQSVATALEKLIALLS